MKKDIFNIQIELLENIGFDCDQHNKLNESIHDIVNKTHFSSYKLIRFRSVLLHCRIYI